MYYPGDRIYKTVQSVYLNGKKLKKTDWYEHDDSLGLNEKIANSMKNKKNKIIVHYIVEDK